MASEEHESQLLEEPPLPSEVNGDIISRTLAVGDRFKALVTVLAILVSVGIAGFLLKAMDGFDDRREWAYYAAIFAFLFTTTQSALLVSITMRMAKTHWRRPLARISEMFAIVGVFNLLMFLPLLWTLPPVEDRSTIWFEWPWGAPKLLDALAMIFLVVCGLALLWVSSIPDMAVTARRGTGFRQSIARLLSVQWDGTARQWKVLQAAQGLLGAFYFLFLIFVHLLISSDFAMSLVPGWVDAIFPPFQALTGLQTGMATVLVTLFLVRKFGNYDRYIYMEQFWALSKILIALTLLWFYFWFAGFITFWYGRKPVEQNVLQLLMTGPYRVAFYAAFALSFVVPFLILMWNWVRKTVGGPSLAAAVILVGAFFDKIRLYVPAFGFTDDEIREHVLEEVQPATGANVPHFFQTNWPDGSDFMVLIGGLALPVFIYMLATRIIPVISMWEVKEGFMLRGVQTVLRKRYLVLAKPE